MGKINERLVHVEDHLTNSNSNSYLMEKIDKLTDRIYHLEEHSSKYSGKDKKY